MAFPPRRRPAARPAARPHTRSPRAHGRSGRWLASAPSSEPPRAAFALPVFASPGGSPSAGSHEAAGLRSRFRGTGEDPTPRQHRAVLPTRAERLCLWSSSVPFVGAVWTPYVRIWLDLGLSISFSDGDVNGIVFLMSNSDCLLPEKNVFFLLGVNLVSCDLAVARVSFSFFFVSVRCLATSTQSCPLRTRSFVTSLRGPGCPGTGVGWGHTFASLVTFGAEHPLSSQE